ncbi:hypothetical protein LNP74_05490 [Klebsiella pneumoniae subsp. pneumoniae]|nr:hypothetical protein [Klebsiella pneumoniae subsp. pneumoniae]
MALSLPCPFMIVGSFLLVFIFPPFSPDTTWGFARAWLQFSPRSSRCAGCCRSTSAWGDDPCLSPLGIAASLAKTPSSETR